MYKENEKYEVKTPSMAKWCNDNAKIIESKDGGYYIINVEAPAKTYQELRQEAYGSYLEQLEFITENGLEAWQKKVAEIKNKYPKD